jgi:hypothetical protein
MEYTPIGETLEIELTEEQRDYLLEVLGRVHDSERDTLRRALVESLEALNFGSEDEEEEEE